MKNLLVLASVLLSANSASAESCPAGPVCEQIFGGPNSGQYVIMIQFPNTDHGREFCDQNGYDSPIYTTKNECLVAAQRLK
jgi:hypothetical protein